MVLQKQDLEAKRLREALAAVPKRLAELAAQAKAVQGQRAVVVELLQKEELLRRQQESEVKDRQAKIAKVQKQLDQATLHGAGDGVRARDRVCPGGDREARGR